MPANSSNAGVCTRARARRPRRPRASVDDDAAPSAARERPPSITLDENTPHDRASAHSIISGTKRRLDVAANPAFAFPPHTSARATVAFALGRRDASLARVSRVSRVAMSTAVVARPRALDLSRSSPRALRARPRARRAEATAAASSYDGKTVVCTRERGKNGALMNLLAARGARCVELPLVEAVPGEDAATFPDVLKRESWDWVCVTSPEAAKVFLEAYERAGRPSGVRVAVVGAGTGKVLAKAEPTTFAMDKQFTPSKATAATMAAELPCDQGSLILYPASKKAATTLQDGLEARGATVVRLNTYSTERVERLSPEDVAAAVRADVVTFGSPSAVRAWVELCGDALYERLTADARALQPAYVCIGETSAEACANCELPDVFYPELPGIEGWAETVFLALDMPVDDRWDGVDLTRYRA